MSAQELRARIEELSSEITLQKKLLKQLEHDKSLVQGQLNAVVDPLERLPLEISSEIFLQCIRVNPNCAAREGDPGLRPMAGAHQVPMLLLNVCNAWSAIALSTPALWSTIQIDFPCAGGLTQLLPIWFQRARNRPLYISLRGDLSNLNDSGSVIWRYGGQIKDLEICDDDDANRDYTYPDINLFVDTTLEPLPLLETLTIRTSTDGRLFLGHQILQLLSLSPNIVECFFDRMELEPDSWPGATDKLVLPTLRRWTFGDLAYCPDSDEIILNRLTLPALEALYVVVNDGLLGFLKRSLPPLQELSLGISASTDIPLREYLGLIPTLLRLTLWYPDSYLAADLFAALANSPSLLPNLCRLTIHSGGRASAIFDSSAWWTLLRMVSSRRIQLYILLVKSPSSDVLAAFRELVADGVEVYIGTEERSLMDSPSKDAT
jgi:hypothetical protein